MSFARYFAQKISFQKTRSLSRLATTLAIATVALGVAIIIISTSIIFGFEREIQSKIIGFVGDIEVSTYYAQAEDSVSSIPAESLTTNKFRNQFKEVEAIEPFIRREGVLKSASTIEGCQMYGVKNKLWNQKFFQKYLNAGRLPAFPQETYSKEVLVSQKIASLLEIKVQDKVKVYFWENGKVRMRPLVVVGIYETGLTEFDQTTVVCDIRLLQRILGWEANEAQGIRMRLQPQYIGNTQAVQEISERIDKAIRYDWVSETAQDRYIELFQWLELQRQHVIFILIALTIIAILNMSSAVVIVITERATTIGLLGALGASPATIRHIFQWNAFYILLIGLSIGNILGLGLLFIQDQTHLIELDAESYFVKSVPVAWVWLEFLKTNLWVLIVCVVSMWLPTQLASRIHPTRALKY